MSGTDGRGRGTPDVSCHGREPWVVDFSYYSRELGVLYDGAHYDGNSLYFAFNFHWDSHEFYLPDICENKSWEIRFDTAETGAGKIENGIYVMQPRSIVVFEQKKQEDA
jgi:glycogen operon protein